MDAKLCQFCIATIIVCCLLERISGNQGERNAMKLEPKTRTFEHNGNSTGPLADRNNNFLVMVPSNFNLSDIGKLKDTNFNLFKLDSDILFTRSGSSGSFNEEPMATGDETIGEDDANMNHGERSNRRLLGENRRESRKINFLKGIWNMPKTSPLYLVNGTVCRFVNSSPICTTLSTTGLLTGGSSTARPTAPNAQQINGGGGGSSVQFANQPAQQTQFRPAAIQDDDLQNINVGYSISNSTDTNTLNSAAATRPAMNSSMQSAMQAVRPINLVVSRRPVNLLALRRPVRHYLTVGNRRATTIN